jgi:hypothetical protein
MPPQKNSQGRDDVQRLTGRRRGRRAVVTAVLAVAALAATASSASALDLVPGAPANPTGGFFDDHSISGDNHAGWGPTEEPLAVRFTASVQNVGAAIQFCGTPAAPNFMAATVGPCGSFGPQFGWFRWVPANHFGHNRWQLLDFQRFALVNVNPGGTEAIWDTRWGSCVNDSQYSDCSTDSAVPQLTNMGFPANSTKVTQDGADEDELIAIPNQFAYVLPEGNWQLLHIVNPYGRVPNDPLANNVTCTPITLRWAPTTAPAASPLIIAARAFGPGETCRVPTPPPPVTGPGDPADPLQFAKAFPITCPPTATGHCWATPPTQCSAANPTARTFISGALVPATDPCAPGAGGGGKAGTSPVSGLSQRAAKLRITTRLARRYAAVALRKALKFKKTPRGVRAACRVTARVDARCSVRWSGSGQSVRGTIWIKFVAGSKKNRWTYRTDLRRTKNGRTSRIRHGYRTGGSLS